MSVTHLPLNVFKFDAELLTAYQLLCIRVPYLQYFPIGIQNNQCRKNVHITGRRPKTVTVWPSFFDDVVDFSQNLSVEKAVYLRPFTGETTGVRKQEDIKLALAAHVYVPVNNWARETFPGREAQFRTNQGDSPCLVDHCAELGKHLLFPIECEATWNCNFRDDENENSNLGLITNWGGENQSEILQFLYSYMLVCQKPLRVLTTYEETWFFSRIPPMLVREVLRGGVPDINDYRDGGHLFISPAIFSESSEPTLLQAFAYFLHLAIRLKDVTLCDDSEVDRLSKDGQIQTPPTEGAGDLVMQDNHYKTPNREDHKKSPSCRRSVQSLHDARQVRGKQKYQEPEKGDNQQKRMLLCCS